MGAVESKEDEEFPFFQMIQWATLGLSEETVMTYDLSAARSAILGIPSDEKMFMETACEFEVLKCYEGTEREVWEDWAEALLEYEELRDFRFRLVPRKISEADFWRKYFSRAKTLVLNTIAGKS